ncbi:hypothetical protein G5V58_14925 [Nocardioides anomalus]|uniref:Exo-alpha-sialidase n=1 Tax=Nocardioides anomalus TaxID=2712223 RepID=A0A6G6WEX1_9ACTN|nr:hypothetical protein [Nocardioides anomalus]QIG43891.1 hypothetical protein G5V58_14925 [Nocardioides anomalus]
MNRLVASGALLLALAAPTALPSPGQAAAPDQPRAGTGLGLTSKALDVVMTNDGAAVVALLDRAAVGQPYAVRICRIPAGGSACALTATLSPPTPDDVDDSTGPWLVTDGTKVVVAIGNHDGAAERTYAAASANGGATFGPMAKVANVTATDVELAPGSNGLWIASNSGPTGAAADYQAFTAAPLPGGAPTSGATFSTGGGSESVDGLLVGVTPEGRPLAFLSGFAPGLANGTYYRAFNGNVVPTEINDMSKWSSTPTRYDLGAPWERNGSYDVTSGAGRLWLGYEGLQRDTVLRPFAGGAFGAPVSPDCVSSRFSSGTQDAPDVAITRTGDLLVTETGSNGNGMFLGFFHGTADGATWSAYSELAAAPGIRDVETAADPTSDTTGIAVWTADDIYGGPVSFARIPSAPPVGCSSDVGAKVGSATVTLDGPEGCVPSGKKYQLKVTRTKGKGTIRLVVFKATGAKKKTDKAAPFKTKLKVKKGAASGSTVKVKAKVTVRQPSGKLKTKSLKTSFTVC